jgi:hypothetical protein
LTISEVKVDSLSSRRKIQRHDIKPGPEIEHGFIYPKHGILSFLTLVASRRKHPLDEVFFILL